MICRTCKEDKPRDAFGTKRGKPNTQCKACTNAYFREYLKDPEAYAKHRARNAAAKKARRKKIRAATYGITVEELEAILAKPCEICGRPSEVVDHCHTTGKVRGGLCHPCNRGLGFLQDDPEIVSRAADYLRGIQRPVAASTGLIDLRA